MEKFHDGVRVTCNTVVTVESGYYLRVMWGVVHSFVIENTKATDITVRYSPTGSARTVCVQVPAGCSRKLIIPVKGDSMHEVLVDGHRYVLQTVRGGGSKAERKKFCYDEEATYPI